MGIKLHRFKGELEDALVFHCPGCKNAHPLRVNSKDPSRPNWEWNGSMDKPTFSPSLLCNAPYPESRCHSFIKDGMIQFLDDCHHSLKGQTVEIPDWDDAEL